MTELKAKIENKEPVVLLPKKRRLILKRLFDIVCSFLGIIILCPLLLIIAVAVGVSSEGGIVFYQKRVGKNGVLFNIYKFRTMKKDNGGLKITAGKDSRITAVGKVLRKTKLDELLQLFNVLKGDMSFVGPRPEVPEYVKYYTDEQKNVLLLRPGITGIASIKYRDESALLGKSDDPEKTYIEKIMPEKIALDMEYLNKAGVFYDIKLIFLTFVAILK